MIRRSHNNDISKCIQPGLPDVQVPSQLKFTIFIREKSGSKKRVLSILLYLFVFSQLVFNTCFHWNHVNIIGNLKQVNRLISKHVSESNLIHDLYYSLQLTSLFMLWQPIILHCLSLSANPKCCLCRMAIKAITTTRRRFTEDSRVVWKIMMTTISK
jgi:hypothetical protein